MSIADGTVGPPTTIGRYVVLNVVGRGAMGEVYAAYDPKLNRRVAIKVLRARPGADISDTTLRLRMIREAQAIAKLSHPNVVVVHDVGSVGSEVFVAMEFIDGQTLSEWLASEPRAWPDVLKIFSDAGRGLAAAHEKNLVHRDFKPDNVMIAADGHVRVMDFGLARSATPAVPWRGSPATGVRALEPPEDNHLEVTREVSPVSWASDAPANVASDVTVLQITRAGAVMGTPAYMAPEQFLGLDTDARTDQFSFCVALHEALYHAGPFDGETLEQRKAGVLAGRVREPPAHNGVPPQIRKLILRGLNRDPTERWPSMKALLVALEDNRRFSGRRRLAPGAAAKLRGVWEAPARGQPVESDAKTEMRNAFLATQKPYAAAAFEGAARVLDDYATRWTAMYLDICEATHVRGEQSPEVMDLRMACLLDCLEDLRALTRLFRKADADVVRNAVRAANALAAIERCADVNLVRAAMRPPDDPATRAAVDRLRARLAEVRALNHVGRFGDGLEALAPLEEEIHRVGYGPLIAEAWMMRGGLRNERREWPLAAHALEEAVWAAELCRHDEIIVEAASKMMFVVGQMGMDWALAEVWSRHAEAVLQRMGGHDDLWGLLFNNRSALRLRQGRLAEGLDEARRALAAKERAGGADNPDSGLSLSNIAEMLFRRGEAAEALQYIERAIALFEAGYGVGHPTTGPLISNRADYLNALGRFDEAEVAARHALALIEPETGPDNLALSLPRVAIAVACLGMGRAVEALPLLERAAEIGDTTDAEPAHAGETHFAMARALRAMGGDSSRARGLAERARAEYARAPQEVLVERALAAIDTWLATPES